MAIFQLEIPDPDQQQAKIEEVLAANVVRTKTRLAAQNRAAGHAEPQPGDRLYVQLQVGIDRRSRAGVVFNSKKRTVVLVTDGQPFDPPTAEQLAEHGVDALVSPDQAEEILGDNALTVGSRSGGDVESSTLRARNAELKGELARVNAELTKLRRARMDAVDTGDGRPVRLQAAAKAKADGETKTPDEGFGGDKK